MNNIIGIRRENKNYWERRVPLTPTNIRELIEKHSFEFIVQPSRIRVFKDEEFVEAGAVVQEDLSPCSVVYAVKEIPLHYLLPDRTHLFFSHVIKGQSYNMPLLGKMMELGCNLIDYECILDNSGKRLIFFGFHAGFAGMVDTFWAFSRRLALEYPEHPLKDVLPAHRYRSMHHIRSVYREVGEKIRRDGFPREVSPVVIGITGYGNVSRGAQDVIDCLPVNEITPGELLGNAGGKWGSPNEVYRVVFHEKDMVVPRSDDVAFQLEDYYAHPEKYRSRFQDYLPRITVLMNCIYWNVYYPRLVTKEYLKELYGGRNPPTLKVIGDISCDIEGAVECTVKCTTPDNPVFTWHPQEERDVDGIEHFGPVIQAVDNLPAEIPYESSEHFGESLMPFIPLIQRADFSGPFKKCVLPNSVKRAVILQQGRLTPDYKYLKRYVKP